MGMIVPVYPFRTKNNIMQQSKDQAVAAATKQDLQNENLALYNRVRSVPEHALKKIEAGRLKGKSDINPMFRIQSLTREFGPVGFGWYTEVTKKWTEAAENGEMAVFVDINLYVHKDGEWSKPIHGTGGNKLLSFEKKWENGEQVLSAYLDDDAYKKAYTDAISVAAKALGIGADVYFESDATKYTQAEATQQPVQSATESRQAAYSTRNGSDKRQSLSPQSPFWTQAVAFTAKLSDSNENILKRVQDKYIISQENCNLLLRQAGKLNA